MLPGKRIPASLVYHSKAPLMSARQGIAQLTTAHLVPGTLISSLHPVNTSDPAAFLSLFRNHVASNPRLQRTQRTLGVGVGGPVLKLKIKLS